MSLTRSRRAAFTLLEVMFAVAVTATALLALQATVTGAILSAGDAINRRAARELAQVQMEKVLVGMESPEGGGTLEDRPQFTWKATSEELGVGMGEAQTEKVLVVTLEFSFPVETGEGRETITLASMMPVEEEGAEEPR